MPLSKERISTETNSALIDQLANTFNYLEYDDDDLAAWDVDEGDLTIDSAWHELDLDSFKTVPSDAIGFFARVHIKDANTGNAFNFRSTSQSNTHQMARVLTQVANLVNNTVIPIPLDSNHKFDYYVTNGTDEARIVVLWWIRQPSQG